MKKVLQFLLIITGVVIVCQCIPCMLSNAEEGAVLNADDIIRNVDPDKVTKAEFKEYFKTIEGKKARGKGKVVNVLPGGRYLYRIAILTSASEPEKGYNIFLYTNQDAPSELKNNDIISFEGDVGRINPYKGASVDLSGTYKKTGEK